MEEQQPATVLHPVADVEAVVVPGAEAGAVVVAVVAVDVDVWPLTTGTVIIASITTTVPNQGKHWEYSHDCIP